MEINKTTSLNSNITIGTEVVGYLSASISTGNYNMSINVTITDKIKVDANVALVKEQYSQFELGVKETATELGYALF